VSPDPNAGQGLRRAAEQRASRKPRRDPWKAAEDALRRRKVAEAMRRVAGEGP